MEGITARERNLFTLGAESETVRAYLRPISQKLFNLIELARSCALSSRSLTLLCHPNHQPHQHLTMKLLSSRPTNLHESATLGFMFIHLV